MLQPSQRYLVGYIGLWKPRTLPQTKPCVMQDQSLIRSSVCDISLGSVGGGDVPLPDSSRALTTHHSLIPQYQKNLVTIFQGHGKSEAQLSSLPASRKSISFRWRQTRDQAFHTTQLNLITFTTHCTMPLRVGRCQQPNANAQKPLLHGPGRNGGLESLLIIICPLSCRQARQARQAGRVVSVGWQISQAHGTGRGVDHPGK